MNLKKLIVTKQLVELIEIAADSLEQEAEQVRVDLNKALEDGTLKPETTPERACLHQMEVKRQGVDVLRGWAKRARIDLCLGPRT